MKINETNKTNDPVINRSTKIRRILIADDDPSISRALSAILNPFGKTIIVDSGNKAIEVIKSCELDLILTDYEMNQGSGLDVLSYMTSQNIKTPTVMITSFGSKDLILKTIRHNVFGFIEKPFTPAIVEDLVKKAFKSKDEADRIQELALLGISMGEMVHEINNPLAVLDLTLSSQIGEETAPRNSDKLIRSVNKIKNIIVNTQSEIRGDKADLCTFNFKEVLDEAKTEFSLKAERTQTSVHYVGDFDVRLNGSPQKIRQVIVNLINNAIDAIQNTTEKWIKLSLDKTDQSVRLTVTDSGTGIPEEIRKKLFEPLFTTKGKNGTGLGLGIVRKIANEHGGTVFLNTDSPHTEFVLVLPLNST